MTDPRKPIADAVRAAGGDFNQPGALAAFDAVMDALGVPRDGLLPSAACFAIIKEFEGCRLTAYPDPGSGGDPWTIGWGSTGADVKPGTVWTQQQADTRLMIDVTAFSAKVARLLGNASTTQHQFDAMVSLAYNIGVGNFSTSTLRIMHKVGNVTGAQQQFARWNKASGKVLSGLVRRRAAEARLYGS